MTDHYTFDIFQNPLIIVCIIGVVAVAAVLLVLIMRKKQKTKNAVKAGGEFPDEKQQKDYELVIERIKQAGKKYNSILFASAKPESLPVTIPVNAAVGLAKIKKRCLLIDTDVRRDAIAKVFGLAAESNGLRPKAVQTEIENLWLWPAHNFTELKQMNIKMIVKKARDKFDFVLINAPSLLSSPDRGQIISAAQAAFICVKDATEATKINELLSSSDCKVIGSIQTPS